MHKKTILVTVIILLLCLSSCQQKESGEKDKQNSISPELKVSLALNKINIQTDKLYKAIEKKDYIAAEDEVKDLNKSWNEFYKDAFKFGVSNQLLNEFVANLDVISAMVLENAKKEKEKLVAIDIKKTEYLLKKMLNEETPYMPKDDGKQQDQKQTDNASNSNGANKDQQEEGNKSGNFSKMIQDIKLPEEIPSKKFPELNFGVEDANCLIACSKLYKNISNLYGTIPKEPDSHIILTQYFLHSMKGYSSLKEWETVKDAQIKAVNAWMAIQASVMKEDEETAYQITQNLNELAIVVRKENTELLKLKCDLIIDNLTTLMRE